MWVREGELLPWFPSQRASDGNTTAKRRQTNFQRSRRSDAMTASDSRGGQVGSAGAASGSGSARTRLLSGRRHIRSETRLEAEREEAGGKEEKSQKRGKDRSGERATGGEVPVEKLRCACGSGKGPKDHCWSARTRASVHLFRLHGARVNIGQTPESQTFRLNKTWNLISLSYFPFIICSCVIRSLCFSPQQRMPSRCAPS